MLPLGETARADLAAGLEGYWRCEQNGADDAGHGRTLDLVGGIGFAAGLNGDALDFPGDVSRYAVRGEDDAVFDFGAGDFTISAWVYYYTTAGEQVLIEKFDGGGGPGWTLTKLGDNRVRFYAQGLIVPDTLALSITTGTWHHALVRRHGDTVEVYWDGAQAAAGSTDGSISDTDMPLLVGRRNQHDGRGFPLNGRVDEVAIWSRGLTDDEVNEVYNGGQGGQIPVGRWGDLNCDGSVDFNDIDAFVTALISRDDYESAYPACAWLNGDINQDGGVDFNDIDPFVECLVNGGCL